MSKITAYTEKTTVDGEELIEVVDLRESSTTDQNKKMTIATLLSSLVFYDTELVTYDGDVVWYG